MKVEKKLIPKETYMLALHVGDKVQAAIEAFCQSKNIRAASFSGIGAICNVDVGEYNRPTKSYTNKKYEGGYELTSIIGNVGIVKNEGEDEKLFVHSHINFTDKTKDCTVFGGHLFEAEVYAVVELFIQVYEGTFFRSKDTITNLNILQP